MAAHSLKWAHFPLKDSAAVAPISTHLSDYSSDYLDCGVVPTQFEYNLFVCEVRASVSPTAAQQQSRICCWRGDIPLCQKHTDPHISVLIRHRLAIAGLIPHISGTHYPSVTRAEASVRGNVQWHTLMTDTTAMPGRDSISVSATRDFTLLLSCTRLWRI